MIKAQTVKCYKCKTDLNIEPETKVMRGDDCDKCGASIRCCRMCLHYDPSSYNDCREPVAERILEKEKANFCDYYVFADNISNKEKNKNKELDTANSLFKN